MKPSWKESPRRELGILLGAGTPFRFQQIGLELLQPPGEVPRVLVRCSGEGEVDALESLVGSVQLLENPCLDVVAENTVLQGQRPIDPDQSLVQTLTGGDGKLSGQRVVRRLGSAAEDPVHSSPCR